MQVLFQSTKKKFKSSFYSLFVLVSLVFVFFSQDSFAQEILYKYEGQAYKKSVVSVTNRTMVKLSDTSFILEASVDTTHQLKYFKSYFDGNEWTHEQFNSLAELMNSENEYRDWLVFVHGFGKTFQTAVVTTSEIQDLHQVNILMFSWPAIDPDISMFKNLKTAMKNIESGDRDFRKLVNEIAFLRETSDPSVANQNVSMIFHSMGNYFVERFGSDTINNKIDKPVFDNLVINSAAVGAKGHNIWVENLSIQKRIYINSNGGDLNLAGFNLITRFGVQLGEMPVAPLAKNANYVNFTSAVGLRGPGPSHSYYYSKITDESQNIRLFYYNLFHGRDIDFSNGLFALLKDYPGYSIYF